MIVQKSVFQASQVTELTADDSYTPLVGSTSRVESPRYRCPVVSCHQVWYRHGAQETIPHCPIHDLALIRDSKGT